MIYQTGMCCNSFTDVFAEVREIERRELTAALKAHGGSFEFWLAKYKIPEGTEVGEDDFFDGGYWLYDFPIILIEDAGFCEAGEYYVKRVMLDKGCDEIFLYCSKKNKQGNVESRYFLAYDVAVGHLSTVTMYIPRTDKVKDVRVGKMEMEVDVADDFWEKRMKYWRKTKAKHPNTRLLFRCRDFYELYDEDAVYASNLLRLTLTQRRGVDVVNFPCNTLDINLPKLIRANQRVAILDDMNWREEGTAKRER